MLVYTCNEISALDMSPAITRTVVHNWTAGGGGGGGGEGSFQCVAAHNEARYCHQHIHDISDYNMMQQYVLRRTRSSS